MLDISRYLQGAIVGNASDVHLVSGQKPTIRVQGELEAIDETIIDGGQFMDALPALLSKEQLEEFQQEQELDFGYSFEGVRFRMNLHFQEGKPGLSARLIPTEIPTPEVLRFEPALHTFTELLDGLVLVVGPTGHGKSTTIASMVEKINQERKAHIVTVEDPIEFLFEEKQSIIEQREVGTDTKSFEAALKHVLRQDPNVILVGEMRDPETISTVLTAAETGHLVFSTLHTSTAAEAVERIVDVFEGSRQKQVLIQLSAVLRGIVAQQLLPAADGTRVVAREVLVNTPAVSNLIRENNIAQIQSVIQTNAKEGMIPMENAVKKLLEEGLITEEVAERRIGRARKV